MTEECRCPNCFRGAIDSGRCALCGFDRAEEKGNPLRLPEMFLLEGRYLLGRVLGSGGFGITYKAFDTFNQCHCAVKEFIPTGLVTREAGELCVCVRGDVEWNEFEHGKKRFMDEAEVLRRLTDVPEVVQIMDYFMQNGTAYFVMEYIEGANLKQLMQAFGGKIPVRDALNVFYHAGMALDQVHKRAGIFHRDISPDNIMVDSGGQMKLIDFGSAKYITGKKSQTLSVVLKRGYAPPEQYSSTSSQGSYTDVYALAAAFYYVVTGILLPSAPDRFGGEEYVPLKDLEPSLSRAVSDAVDRALVLNSKQRTQSAAEFVRDFIKEERGTSIYEGTTQSVYEREERRASAYLKIAGGSDGAGWELPVNRSVFVGRSEEHSDIVPTRNGIVSKRHCEIFCDVLAGKFYLVDHSTNGTYYREERLVPGKAYVLGSGDVFSLGNHICDLEVGWKYE